MSGGLERRKISGIFVIAGRLRRGREWKNLLRYFRYDLITNAYTIVFSSNGKYNCSSGVSNWELESSSFTGLPRSSLVLTIAISVIKLHRVVRGYPWRVPWMRRQSCPKNFVSSSLSTESNRSLSFPRQNKSSCPSLFQRCFDRSKNTFSKSCRIPSRVSL